MGKLHILALVLLATAIGCGHTEGSVAESSASTDYAGTYTNSGGATLVVSQFVAGTGFDFQLKIRSEDACDSVDYSGAATFGEPNTATSRGGDAFKFGPAGVQLEPSVEMIGMDCARVIGVAFAKQL